MKRRMEAHSIFSKPFDPRTIKDIGKSLRVMREEKGDTLSAIASSLCIRVCYLEAIEEGETEKLPGATYYRGFLFSYAKALGLDIDRLIVSSQEKIQVISNTEEDVHPEDMPDLIAEKTITHPVNGFSSNRYQQEATVKDVTYYLHHIPKTYLFGFAGFVIALGWLFFQIVAGAIAEPPHVSGKENGQSIVVEQNFVEESPFTEITARKEDTFSDVSQSEVPQIETKIPDLFANISEGNTVSGITALVESAPSVISIKARQASWVAIVALTPDHQEGELVFSKVMRKGETYAVPNQERLFMKTGNADALDIVLDGKPFLIQNFSGVTGYLLLDEEKIKEGVAISEALAIARILPDKSFFALR